MIAQELEVTLHMAFVDARQKRHEYVTVEHLLLALLDNPSAADALRAVLDYGQAIKDLARSGIFPGDLLLKNFGVTRNRRAIFYDYDELCLVTDCRFRRLPQAQNEEEEMHHGAWYHVDANDVFPEQFPRFLGLSPPQLEALLAAHGEIFDVGWWLELKRSIQRDGVADVPPYPEAARLGIGSP